MAHAFLIFDFGTNEESSQQARHRVEGWKQGFRLGNKILMKFAQMRATRGAAKADADEATESGNRRRRAKSKDEGRTEVRRECSSGSIFPTTRSSRAALARPDSQRRTV